jgi:hypothetical protein
MISAPNLPARLNGNKIKTGILEIWEEKRNNEMMDKIWIEK